MNEIAREKCLTLLAHDQDEHKFAGLLLLTRVAEPNDYAFIHRAFDALGEAFLVRMLATSGCMFL